MKKKITISTIITIFFLSFSCKEKENSNKINSMIDLNIRPILIEQMKSGNDQSYGGFDDYGEKDLNALVLIEAKILNNNGYKKIDTELFNQKVEEIFDRNIVQNSKNKYIKIETYSDNKCNKKLIYAPYTADAQYLYITKKQQFITDFHALPQVLDYLKLYPELSEYEKKDIEIYDAVANTKVRASQWKDNLKELTQEREKNILTIVNRNKYLFNDDKASFAWLKFNDDKFLNDLVKIFGYVKDEKLLSFALSKNINDKQEFCKILWNHKCDGKAIFHQEVFNLVKTYDEKKRHDFLDNLSLKIINLKKIITENPEITFSQKAELLGKIAYNAEKLAQLDNYQTYQFFKTLNEDVFQREFEKQNYYNIQDFKEVYDEAKTGGINFAE